MATTETDEKTAEPQDQPAADAADTGAGDAATAEAATEPEPAKAPKNRASRKAKAKAEVVEEPAPAADPMADNPAQQVMDRNTEFERQRLADQQRRHDLRASGVSSEDVNEIERKEAEARKG